MKYVSALVLIAASFVLAGTAHAQAPAGSQPQVGLGITQPANPGGSGTISGFNLYRAPSGTTTYAKLNTVLITPAGSYTDNTVVRNQTYLYCATEVDSKNTESPCSATLTVVEGPSVNPPVLSLASQQ